MNAYWYPADRTFGSCIRLQDHWGEYVLSLQEKKTYLLRKFEGRVYAGEISESRTGSGASWSSSASGKRDIQVFVGGNVAADITETEIGSTAGQYFGLVDGQRWPLRFVTVSEAAEQRIEMVREP